MKYFCSKCKLAVIVLPDQVIKACKCDAPITAGMSASFTAKATVKGGK